MTELKSESQSTRIVQTQPTAKRQATKSTPIAASGGKESTSESIVESTTEETPAKKPRTTKTKKTAQPRQAASKSPNQSASTRVKLTWEPSPLIEATLHQFNEQLNATWVAIDELKATVERMQAQDLQSGVRLPLEPPKEQMSDRTSLCQGQRAIPSQSPQTRIQPNAIPSTPQSLEQAPVRSRVRNPEKPQPGAIPAFRPTSGSPTSARLRRRKTINIFMQSILKLPTKNAGIAIDAALWVMASAGLRVGLEALITAIPILRIPVMLLVFVPALLAAYAALFIPQVNRIGIYRLLLLALGLFVGGRI